ncbi:MAG: MBL fold metallo-hydrolase [Patescibacteria group bacterium]|jgi:L-ascorbate metabolism protein UlaG (beta-lactamase superfamily)|nr:MBL fold metallo-hydrolase [Patescibacteria group bacterium]
MELRYYGANCIKITTKKASLVVDDTLAKLGKKSILTEKDISIVTNKDTSVTDKVLFKIDKPGEYEISEITITGVSTKLHYDPEKPSTMYSIHTNGINTVVLGHTVSDLTEQQLEALGIVDVLVVPVGDGGYTLDAIEALKVIKNIEPKIVIPVHYQSKGTNYEVPQSPIDEFLKSYGSSDVVPEDALKLKDAFLPDKTRLVLLNEL